MRAIFVICVCLISAITFCQTPTSPKQGSAERKAILDAMRVPIEKDLKQKVKFQVDHLRVLGKWAFMSGKTLTPAGNKIDYRKTKYREALEAGAFDDWACALLKKEGSKWKIVRFAIGATDVVWDGWYQEFKAPKSIFPYGN